MGLCRVGKIVYKNAVLFSHLIMKNILANGDVVIDATCGNGHDTLFLANLVGKAGSVYAFDIQAEAINNTRQKLIENNLLDRVKLIHDTHENIDNYLDVLIDGAMFNLGYLPNSNTSLITLPNTTLVAVQKVLALLKEGGLVTIVFYTGHSGGLDELELLKNYSSSLPQSDWAVSNLNFINQINHPPQLITIQRLRR